MRDIMDVSEEFEKHSEEQEPNVAAILTLAEALVFLGHKVERLGLNNAGTGMGAMESLGAVMKDGLEGLSKSVDHLAESISEQNEDDEEL